MSRQHHYLKCETYYFQEAERGVKSFEVRLNDRGYRVGDMVYLQESVNGKLTGRELQGKEILFVLESTWNGIEKGYCVFQLEERTGQ